MKTLSPFPRAASVHLSQVLREQSKPDNTTPDHARSVISYAMACIQSSKPMADSWAVSQDAPATMTNAAAATALDRFARHRDAMLAHRATEVPWCDLVKVLRQFIGRAGKPGRRRGR